MSFSVWCYFLMELVLRKWLLLSFDLAIVAFSPFVAILILEDFYLTLQRIKEILPYTLICFIVSFLVFVTSGIHRGIWRYVSLPDFWKILKAVVLAMMITTYFYLFVMSVKYESVSFQLLQWGFVLFSMIAFRVCVRHILRRTDFHTAIHSLTQKENVLVIGLTHIAELYLRWVNDVEKKSVNVVGILDEREQLKGRCIQSCHVIGSPKLLPQILENYKIHGMDIQRVVIALPYEKLSSVSKTLLSDLEQRGRIKIDMFSDQLSTFSQQQEIVNDHNIDSSTSLSSIEIKRKIPIFSYKNKYLNYKRFADIVFSLCMILCFSPIIFFVGLLVLLDQGHPITFWQLRPGKNGQTFRLYKFKTMSSGLDRHGNRLPDRERTSMVGHFLRRSRLDELPQLYNILIGQMSFVGPRPLLMVDQPEEAGLRLLVRPGLTGWAQVNGGKSVSKNDKAILDLWYLHNASLWLDLKIVFLTLHMVVFGERLNHSAIEQAYKELVGEGRKFQELINQPKNNASRLMSGSSQRRIA